MATNVGVAARDCHDICNAFREKLNHWIRHPTSNGKMDLRDRFRIAWMGEKEVVLFNQQLVALKSTFTIVMLINTYHVTRQQVWGVDAMKSQLDNVEASINRAGDNLYHHIDDLQRRYQQPQSTELDEYGRRGLPHSRNGEPPQAQSISTNDRASQDALTPSLQHMLDKFERICEGARADLSLCRLTITRVTNLPGSRAIVGAHGVDLRGMNMQIDRVSTGSGSRAVVGVTQGLNLDRFWD